MKRWIPITTMVTGLTLGFGAQAVAQDEERPVAEILDEVSGRMIVVVRDLSKQQTGKPTQTKQNQIVSTLDQVILLLEKECKQCQGGTTSTAFPDQPLPDSRIIGGPGGIGDLHAPDKGGKKWAQLPPRERERILQAMTDGFPPHYKRVLERYYRRLAEEETAAVAVPGATRAIGSKQPRADAADANNSAPAREPGSEQKQPASK